MPWFEYKGLTPGGTLVAGRLEAAGHDVATEELKRMQVSVRELNAAAAPARETARLTGEDLIFFNEQLASLADAGIALDEGLAQLARDVESPTLRKWIEGIVADLRSGRTLEQAIAEREQGLPILYSQVVRAGVQSGELASTLLNLNQHLRLTGNTRRIIWETASYPLTVLALALAIVCLMFMFVIPQFASIYRDFDTQLPAITEAVLHMVYDFPQIVTLLIVVVVGAVLVWHVLRLSKRGRSLREKCVFSLPIVGQIYRSSLIARFLRAVSTSIATGIALPEALRLGAGATGSTTLIDDAEFLAGEVERGESVFVANQSARTIPPLFGFCVQTAVSRNALPEALAKLAHAYEQRAVHNQSMMRTLLFPLIIVALGGFVGLVIIALFLPLVSLIQCMSGGG